MNETAGKPQATGAEAPAPDLFQQVGDRVRAARAAEGITRKVLSERSGVSPRYLAKLEGGDGNISIGLLQRVAEALNRPLEHFVAQDDGLTGEAARLVALYRQADAEARARVMEVLDPRQPRGDKAERICLVGLRGAGKSTLGALVSADLGIPFVELTEEIGKSAGMPVGEIIALYGQEGYRQIEAETLARVADSDDRLLLAVAGGIVDAPATYERLLERFHTIWIKAAPQEHMDRVRGQGDLRPMAGNPRAMTQLQEILRRREARYRQAGHRLDTSGRSLAQSRADLSALIMGQGMLSGPSHQAEDQDQRRRAE